jgi:hypothetical protein
MLPESVFHYVMRTQESVILDDAKVQSPFSTIRTSVSNMRVRFSACRC